MYWYFSPVLMGKVLNFDETKLISFHKEHTPLMVQLYLTVSQQTTNMFML